MKKRTALSLCFVCLVALCALCACASSTAKTVQVGKDTAPTVCAAVGKRKITGTEKGFQNDVRYVVLSYGDGDVTVEDTSAFVQTLRDEGYLVTRAPSTEGNVATIQLGKESTDEGKIVLIDLSYSLTGGSLKVSYQSGAGTITPNDPAETI